MPKDALESARALVNRHRSPASSSRYEEERKGVGSGNQKRLMLKTQAFSYPTSAGRYTSSASFTCLDRSIEVPDCERRAKCDSFSYSSTYSLS